MRPRLMLSVLAILSVAALPSHTTESVAANPGDAVGGLREPGCGIAAADCP